MGVVWAWLRINLRRRGRSLTVLALLVAVSSGTVMTAVAGSRRGERASGSFRSVRTTTTTPAGG
jgi:hypothetical protein